MTNRWVTYTVQDIGQKDDSGPRLEKVNGMEFYHTTQWPEIQNLWIISGILHVIFSNHY